MGDPKQCEIYLGKIMSQYKSILKATSIFGGTQLLQIIINIARAKFVAIFIGAMGMGIASMYSSTLAFMITLFGAGINVSVVRDISKAYDESDINKVALIIGIFRRILIVLTLLGTISVIVLSPLLSSWGFHDDSEVQNFCWLSLMLFFTLLQQGNTALLISLRRIKDVAKCSLLSSFVTLLVSVPFFYFLRLDGIVPGFIISTFAGYLISLYYANKVELPNIRISIIDIKKYGRSILLLGLAMVVSQLLGNLATYVINVSISRIGSMEDIGYYNAGINITMQSIMLIFSAMASDYYPRLSASIGNKTLFNETINQQTEIILYLATPILLVLELSAPLVTKILLSEEFCVIIPFLRLLCVGMVVKAASYALGYVSFASGDKKIFLLLEGIYGNFTNVLLSIFFYWIWGLNGLAISFIVNFILYYIIVMIVVVKRYGYVFDIGLAKLTFYSILLISLMTILSNIMTDASFMIIGTVLCLIVSFYYIRLLEQKTGMLNIFINKIIK